MRDVRELLRRSEIEPVRSAAADVAELVARRRRRRRFSGALAGAVVVTLITATAIALDRSGGSDGGNVAVAGGPGDASRPADDLVSTRVGDGPLSDTHVERADLVFPECSTQETEPDPARDRELLEMYLGLLDEGVLEEPEFVNGVDFTFTSGVLRIALSRFYGPTVDWFVERVDVANLCFDPIISRGFYTRPPDLLAWTTDYRHPLTPETTEVHLLATGCHVDVLGATWNERTTEVEVAVLYRKWPGPQLACVGAYPVTALLTEPLGDRDVIEATSPTTLSTTSAPVAPGDGVTFVLDPELRSQRETIGDDVILQAIDHPSRQIQISGIFDDMATTSLPTAITQDRWTTPLEIQIPIPATIPAGEYSVVFIDDPEFNGTVTIEGNNPCPATAEGLRLSGGTLIAEKAISASDIPDQPDSADNSEGTACWYSGAQLSAPLRSDDRVTTAVIYYRDGRYVSGSTTDDQPPFA
jgi:hypothetical protein